MFHLLFHFSAVITSLLGGYGVLAPMLTRDVAGRGDLFAYLDQISLKLNPNNVDVEFHGEVFVGYAGSKIPATLTLHQTTWYVYCGSYPVFSVELQPIRASTTKRAHVDVITQLQILNTSAMNQFMYDSFHGNNSNLMLQSHLGVSIFGIPTLQKVFCERIMIPENSNLRNIIQTIFDGTFVMPEFPEDPTQQESPKPMIPPLKIPTLEGLTVYTSENEIGLDVQFQWENNFVTTKISDLRLNITVFDVIVGGVFLKNLNLYEGTVKSNVQLGVYYFSDDTAMAGIQNTVTKFFQDFAVDGGVSGPLLLTADEPITWLRDITEALNVTVHLDFASLLSRAIAHMPALPKTSMDTTQMRPVLSIKTVKDSLLVHLKVNLPKVLSQLSQDPQISGLEMKLHYIHDLLNLKLDYFQIKGTALELKHSINFENRPEDLHALVTKVLGQSTDENTFDVIFLSPRARKPFTLHIDIAAMMGRIKQIFQIIIQNSGSGFQIPKFKLPELNFKIIKLHINQQKEFLNVDFDCSFGLAIPVEFIIGYFKTVIQLNEKDAYTAVVKRLSFSNSKFSISLQIEVHNNPAAGVIIQHILDNQPLTEMTDSFSIAGFQVGESKSTATTLFDQIGLTIPIALVVQIAQMIKLPPMGEVIKMPPASLFYHLITPTEIQTRVENTIQFNMVSLFDNPFVADLYIHFEQTIITLNTIQLRVNSIEISDNLNTNVEITFFKGDLNTMINKLIEGQLDVTVSLQLSKSVLLQKLHIVAKIPKMPPTANILPYVMNLVDFSQLNLTNPISNITPRSVAIRQYNSTITTVIDATFDLNVPISLFVSKFRATIRLSKSAFLQVTTNTIQLNGKTQNNFQFQADLLFIPCEKCHFNPIVQKLLNHQLSAVLGIQDLHLGNINALQPLVVDIPLSLTIPPLPPMPPISPEYKQMVMDALKSISIKSVSTAANDNSISFSAAISNPLPFLSIHFQNDVFNIGLHKSNMIAVRCNTLDINSTGIALDSLLTFDSQYAQVLADQINLLSSGNSSTFHFGNMQIDAITVFREIVVDIPFQIPPNMMETMSNTIMSGLATQDTNTQEPSSITITPNSIVVTTDPDNSISSEIRINVDMPAVFNAATHFYSMITNNDIDLKANLAFRSIPLVLNPLVVGLDSFQIANITLFSKIVVDIPVDLSKLTSLPTPFLPNIRLPELNLQITDLNIVNTDDMSIQIGYILPMVQISIPYIYVTAGVTESSIKLQISITTNPETKATNVQIHFTGNASPNEQQAINGLLHDLIGRRPLTVFINSIQFGLDAQKNNAYQIAQQITVPALPLPTTLPQIPMPAVGLNTINEVTFITATTYYLRLNFVLDLQLATNINVNTSNIDITVRLQNERAVQLQVNNFHIQQQNNRLYVNLDVLTFLFDVSDNVQTSLNTLVTSLMNRQDLPNIGLEIANINLPNINSLAATSIPIPIPSSLRLPTMPAPDLSNLPFSLGPLDMPDITLVSLTVVRVVADIAYNITNMPNTRVNVQVLPEARVGFNIFLMEERQPMNNVTPIIAITETNVHADLLIQQNGGLAGIIKIVSNLFSGEYVYLNLNLQQNLLNKIKVRLDISTIAKQVGSAAWQMAKDKLFSFI